MSSRIPGEPLKHRLPGLLLLSLLMYSGGCQPAQPLGDVHGRVSFRGTPIKAGIVGFDGGTATVTMTANVNENGEFRVSMAKGYGLPLGTYRVAIYPFVADLPIGSKERPAPREFPDIPQRYRQPATSELTITVTPGDNPYDIDMKP
jgi:hypothetical protein